MKAQVLHAVGEYPRLLEVPETQVPDNWTLVRLKAAALNHRDLYMVQDLYPGMQLPCILGSDGVGHVDGRRVVLLPGLYWGNDERVQSSRYEVLGMPSAGTFAEYIALPHENIYDCPSHLSDTEAAALPLGGLTAYRALFTRGQANPGETVVVTGAGGGVALFAIQFAVAHGCKVYVTSSSEEKIAFAKTLGALGGVNYRDANFTKQLKQLTGGVDVVVDGAGGEGLAQLTKIMNPAGRLAFYGGTTGKIPALSPQLMFWRQLTLAGSTMGSPREFAAMLELVRKHKLRPVVDSVRPLAELGDALKRMEAGEQRGKLVVSISE